MFGYVRAFKPYLRVCEYETYQAIYCGLCKEMARLTGQASRFALSYDVTFLAVMNMSVNDIPVTARRMRCPVHPINKRLCVYDNKGLMYPAFVSALLAHYKLSDDISDGKNYQKLLAMGANAGIDNGYRRAALKYPELDKRISELMKLQAEHENKREPVLDIACDPTAQMMREVFGGLTKDVQKRVKLEKFGYSLGRFVYITDALDDLRSDIKKNCYNPLALTDGIKITDGRISDDDYKRIVEITDLSINLSLAEIADSFVDLDLKMYRATLDNIIYVGLRNVYELVREGRFNKRMRSKGDKI